MKLFYAINLITLLISWRLSASQVENRESKWINRAKGFCCDGSTLRAIERNRVAIPVVSVVLVLLVGGVFIFGYCEPLADETPVDNRFIVGLFYTFTVLTTIGYGAQNVVNEWSRAIVCIWAIVGIALYGFIVEKVASNSGSSFVARQTRLRGQALDHAGELGTLFPKLNPEGKRLVLERLQNISGVVVVNPGPQQMTDGEENELPRNL